LPAFATPPGGGSGGGPGGGPGDNSPPRLVNPPEVPEVPDVTKTPEPAAVATVLSGLIVFGLALRRKCYK